MTEVLGGTVRMRCNSRLNTERTLALLGKVHGEAGMAREYLKPRLLRKTFGPWLYPERGAALAPPHELTARR